VAQWDVGGTSQVDNNALVPTLCGNGWMFLSHIDGVHVGTLLLQVMKMLN